MGNKKNKNQEEVKDFGLYVKLAHINAELLHFSILLELYNKQFKDSGIDWKDNAGLMPEKQLKRMEKLLGYVQEMCKSTGA